MPNLHLIITYAIQVFREIRNRIPLLWMSTQMGFGPGYLRMDRWASVQRFGTAFSVPWAKTL